MLNIPRKATLAQVGDTTCPGASWGASDRLVNAVATAAVVIVVVLLFSHIN